MNMDTWFLYVGTVLLFMSTPGPSHLLMVSVSMTNGFTRSLATAVGDLSANTVQILLAGFGLAAVVIASQYGFAIIKWAGVAYLVYIGVRQIIASFNPTKSSKDSPATSVRSLWFRGFVTSAANPKAVVFFAALFPQFLDTQLSLAPQIAILGITYILIDGCFLALYGKGASWVSQKLRSRHRVWVDRLAGISLVSAAVMLGLRANSRT